MLVNIIAKTKHIEHDKIERTENVGNNLYQSGRKKEFLRKILKSIEKAQEMICFSSFIISDEEIINALFEASRERGIRVYVLTSPDVYLTDAPDESQDFRRKVKENHEKFLNDSVNRIFLRGGKGLHTKFILIDPKTNNMQGYLFTVNFTTEAFGRNFEIGIELEKEQIKDFLKQFIIGFWFLANRENINEKILRDVSKFKIEVDEPKKILTTIANQSSLKYRIKKIILETSGKLVIGIYSFQDKYELVELLVEQAKKGREILIFTRKTEANMVTLMELKNYNTRIYMDQYYHAKFIFTENNGNPEAILFTANLTALGLEEGFESGVDLNKSQIKSLEKIIQEWQKMFTEEIIKEKKIEELEKNAYIQLEHWQDKKIKGFKLESECIVKIPEITLKDIDDEPKQPELKKPDNTKDLEYCQYKFVWKINPPKLEEGVKRVSELEKDKKTPYPVYEKNGKLFVVLEKEEELKKVREYAKKIEAKIKPSKQI